NFDWPDQTEVSMRLRDILEQEVDEKYYLDEDKTAKLVAQLEDKTEGIAVKEATSKGYAVAAEGDAVNFQFPDSKTRRGRVGKQIANTLEASNINQGVVGLSEPCMLGHIDLKGRDAIKRVYSADHIGPTLTTMGGGHREPKTAVSEGSRYRIRKLTPLECWRLQGFRDEAHDAVMNAGISDSQRYKMAGNAVSVPVISAIGKRLLPFIASAEK